MFPNIPVCRGIACVALVAAVVGVLRGQRCECNDTLSVSRVSHKEVCVVHVSSS